MYCKKCLGTIEEGEKFCTSCGAPVEIMDTEEVASIEEDINLEDENQENTFVEAVTEEVVEPIKTKSDDLRSPLIQLDPKTGKSIMPEEFKGDHEIKIENSENSVEKVVPPIRTAVQPLRTTVPPIRTAVPPVKNTINQANKVVDKTAEFIVGIIGVALSFLTSLISAFFFIGIVTVNIIGEDSSFTDTTSDNFLMLLFIIVGLKGFVFAIIGLVGVLNVKKNSSVAGLFFMSAAVGSLFSIQLIRGGLFLGAAIMCFNRHEKTQKPIIGYIIGAFAPTLIVLILMVVSFVFLGISNTEDTYEEINSVQVISHEMITTGINE